MAILQAQRIARELIGNQFRVFKGGEIQQLQDLERCTAQLARNPPPRVIQVVSAPIATEMASTRVYPMTVIDVEDIVNNVVQVLQKVVVPKTGRSDTLNGLTTPLRCTPAMSNKPTLGFNIACAQNQLKRFQFNWSRKKIRKKGTV